MSDVSGIGAERLRSYIERIERLEEEKTALTADIREVFSEAKGEGFDTKVMRQVIRLRKMDSGDRQEQEAILDLYKHALGMLSDTPLGEAAMRRATSAPATQKAAQKFVDSIPEGGSVSVEFEGGKGVHISKAGGKTKVEPISRGAMA